jgi:hypothetical protein
MKPAICCFLLFTAGLCAQSTAKLDADLVALSNPVVSRNAVALQITDDILALAEKDAQPSRQTVFEFAEELTKASLNRAGKPVIVFPKGTQPTLQTVTQAILDVLHSSGVPSSRFHEAIDRFRNAIFVLSATPAEAKSAADRLLILGQEIRGPEDIKLLNVNGRSK